MSEQPTNMERNMDEDERVAAIKKSEAQGREGIGQPGLESASGRDRAGGELPRNFGTNQGDIAIDRVAPPPGSVQGTRVSAEGDPTGPDDSDAER